MKLGTWNVNGIRKRSTEVLSWIDREEPDVVCLQETKAALHQIPQHILDVAGYHCHWHGHAGYSGVALMLRQRTFGDAPTWVHPPFDMETRIAVAEVGSMVLGSVYGPNGGKDYKAKIDFCKDMVLWAAELHEAGKHLVLCGDFNIARLEIDVHPALRKEMIGQSNEERTLFEQFLSHGLIDVHRKVEPDNDRLFTWWAPWRNLRQRNMGWRLDYIAASTALVDDTTVCAAYRDYGTSDHGPVIAHLRDTPRSETTITVPKKPATLAELGARKMTFDDVRALFPDASWLWIFDTIAAGTPVHFVEGELSVDSFEAGDGPWVLIVHGDLHATGDLDFSTSDYKCSLLVVAGSLRARNFQFTNGAQCVVMHDLEAGTIIGRYGDESASLDVEGTLTAQLLLLDHVTGVEAGTIDAVVCSSRGWRLPIDISYEAESHADVFVPEALEEQRIDLGLAWERVATGRPVLLPGVREQLHAKRPEPWREATRR